MIGTGSLEHTRTGRAHKARQTSIIRVVPIIEIQDPYDESYGLLPPRVARVAKSDEQQHGKERANESDQQQIDPGGRELFEARVMKI